jgi:hypothetical protein
VNTKPPAELAGPRVDHQHARALEIEPEYGEPTLEGGVLFLKGRERRVVSRQFHGARDVFDACQCTGGCALEKPMCERTAGHEHRRHNNDNGPAANDLGNSSAVSQSKHAVSGGERNPPAH